MQLPRAAITATLCTGCVIFPHSLEPPPNDQTTVALEHFDGSPAPPLTLTAETEPFHARAAGRAATWSATAPDKFPAGATLSYTISTAGGAVVDRG